MILRGSPCSDILLVAVCNPSAAPYSFCEVVKASGYAAFLSTLIGFHHLKESFCGEHITLCRKHKLDSGAFFIHCAIQIFARLSDFNVSLVDPLRRSSKFQMRANSFIDFRSIFLNPLKDSYKVDRQTSLHHHLFDIAVREFITAVLAHTSEDNRECWGI